MVAIVLSVVATLGIFLRPKPFALGGDNLILTYSLLAESARRVAAGELPLWTEGRWGGSPLAGDPVVGALYPPHIVGYLLTPFPHVRALDVDVAVHTFWLALGLSYWLATLGVRPLAAIVGLLLFLTHPTLIVIARSWVQYWAAVAWWPWLFAAAVRSSKTGRPRHAALAAVAMAAQVYAGYPEFALYSGTAALAWMALGPPRSRVIAIARAGGVGVAAIALALPVILPALAMTAESIRAGATGDELHALLVQLGLSADGLRRVLSSGPVADVSPFRMSPGILLLAVVGTIHGNASARFMAGVALACLILSTGLLHRVLGALPGFAFFPMPLKLLYLFTFATLSLAAVGIDRAAHLSPARRRALVLALAASTLPTLVAIEPHLGWAAGAGGAIAMVIPERWLQGAVAAAAIAMSLASLVATGALHSAWGYGVSAYRPLLEQPLDGESAGRRLNRSLALSGGTGSGLRQVGLDFGSLFGQPSWNGLGPLAQSRQLAVMEHLEPGAAPAIAAMLGASPLVVRAGSELDTEIVASGFAGPPPRRGLRALYAADPLPRFSLAPRARRATREEAIRAARRGGATAPELLVEANGQTSEDGGGGAADAPPGDPSGQLRVVDSRPGKHVLDVSVDRATWLLAREPYYPGWHAEIDGAAAIVRPAAGFLFALEIPAGRHRVDLEYREPGFARGALYGAAALLALGALASAQSRRGRK